MQAYEEICMKYVSENILTQYMYKTMSSTNSMWTFKKQFTLSLAMTGGVGVGEFGAAVSTASDQHRLLSKQELLPAQCVLLTRRHCPSHCLQHSATSQALRRVGSWS